MTLIELLKHPSIASMDFVYINKDETYRGPIKHLRLIETTNVFTIVTEWVGHYNPVNMRWVRWLPSGMDQLILDFNAAAITIDNPNSTFMRLVYGGKTVGFLIPHSYSKLTFEELL